MLDFVYSDDVARAVSVHSSGIIEALRKVYRADKLVEELLPPAKSQKAGASRQFEGEESDRADR